MKKRSKLRSMIAIMMLAMMFCLPVVATSVDDTESTGKTLVDDSVIVGQVYLVEGENADDAPIPRAKIFDGTTLLEEGEDYNLSLVSEVDEDDFVYYYVTITGVGDYEAEDVELTYEFDEELVGEELVIGDWTIWSVAYDEGDGVTSYDSTILSYDGDEADVEVPECLGDDDEYYIYDMSPGAFYNLENLETVDLYDCIPLKGAMFINCPNLVSVKTIYDTDGGEEVETTPGPLVVGSLNGSLSVVAPADYSWLIYDEETETETELTLQKYCEDYGYHIEIAEDLMIVGDWTYQVSTSDGYATIVSYNGEDSNVVVPLVVQDGDEEYDVYDIKTNAFDGLETLEAIDLQELSLIANLCKDCPNLKSITSRGNEVDLDGPIVTGEAPEQGALTLNVCPGLEWEIEDEETGDYVLYTMQDYCEDYGYVYAELEEDYLAFDIVTEDEAAEVVAGDTVRLYVYVTSDLNAGFLDEIFEDAAVKDWTVLGNASEHVKISNIGELTVGTGISEKTQIVVQCTVVRETTSATGETVEEETKVTSALDVYPRLTGNKNVLLPQGGSQSLTCKMYVYSEDEWEVIEENIPEDASVTYASADEKIVTVNEGVISAVDDAEVGAVTTVTATYTLNGKEYTFTYHVEIVESADISEVGTETIYVYGWSGCGFDKQLQVFENMYPDLKGRIVYTAADLEDVMDSDEDDPWDVYAKMVENAFSAEEKVPDIVLWPAHYVSTCADNENYVSLDTIGFDASAYDTAFPYVKANGTVDGKLYAVATSVNPGCFVYNKAMALEVFGTDDATAVQEKVKDWATFIASAKTLREKEYYMLSNLDVEHLVFGGKTKPWVQDGVLALEDNATAYLSLMRQLYLADVVSPDDVDWDSYGDISYQEDCFGFFADADYITGSTQFGAHEDEYGICAGPVYFCNDSAPYISVTTTRNNDQLVKLLLETLTTNGNVMESCMSNGLGIMNHEAQLTAYVEAHPEYSVWLEVAKNIPVVSRSVYDYMLEDAMMYYYTIYYWVDELSKEEIEAVELNDLLNSIKNDFKELYPSLEITTPTDVEWDDVTQEDSSGSGGEEPGSGEDNPGTGENPGTEEQPGTSGENPDSGEQKPESGKEDNDASGNTSTVTPNPGATDNTVSPKPGETTGNTTFGKNSEFTKGNNRYKVLSIKGKTGTVMWLGLKSKKVKTIKIPNTVKKNAVTFKVTSIAKKACKNNKKIKKITIPKNVTSIGKEAFRGCKNLKTIKISSKKLKSVGKKALKGINKKAVIDVPNKKVKPYKKLFKKKGQAKTVKIK